MNVKNLYNLHILVKLFVGAIFLLKGCMNSLMPAPLWWKHCGVYMRPHLRMCRLLTRKPWSKYRETWESSHDMWDKPDDECVLNIWWSFHRQIFAKLTYITTPNIRNFDTFRFFELTTGTWELTLAYRYLKIRYQISAVATIIFCAIIYVKINVLC